MIYHVADKLQRPWSRGGVNPQRATHRDPHSSDCQKGRDSVPFRSPGRGSRCRRT